MAGSPPFSRFLDQLPGGVFVIDRAGRPVYANSAAMRLLGRGIVAGIGVSELAETYRAVVAGTDREYPVERMPIVRALAGEESTIDDMEIATPAGKLPIEVWAAPVRGAGGVEFALAVFQDISRRRRAEGELAAVRRQFQAAFYHAPTGMAMLSLDERLLEVNDSFCTLLGYRRQDLLGRRASELVEPEDRDADREQLEDLRQGRIPSYRIEKRYRRSDGRVVWTIQARSLVVDVEGRPLFINQVENISERKRNEEELVWRALHDPLTGLPNRYLLSERLERALARLARRGGSVGLLYLDLDGFKPINDRFGHAAGDALLRQVAQRIAVQLRRQDTPARVGGDEFVVLCEDVAEARQLEKLAGRLGRTFESPFWWGDDAIELGASVGLALADDGDVAEALLARADAAMYDAKRHRHRHEV